MGMRLCLAVYDAVCVLHTHTHMHARTHTHTHTHTHRPDDDEPENSAAIGCAKISQFFTPKTVDISKKRHRFFEERGLKPFSDF